MSDLTNSNRTLIIKRQQHAKLVALSQIEAREIRKMELEEEMARCNEDIVAQNKVISVAEENIKQQQEELKSEQEAKKNLQAPSK